MKVLLFILLFFISGCATQKKVLTNLSPFSKEITETLRAYILKEAAWALTQEPLTVTAHTSSRSAGGKHDFFSEGDYWWPNPANADSPYIQKDGMTNPCNLVGSYVGISSKVENNQYSGNGNSVEQQKIGSEKMIMME